LLLVAAPLLPALLTGRTLYYRDVGQNHLPNRVLTVQMLRAGHLPLWNPYRGGGQPFLANPNSLVLRPTTLLFLPFSPGLVHVPLILSVILLLGVAAAGTWAFLRDTGHSGAACFVGASAFALSGAVQSLAQVLNHLEGVAWIPVTLWLANRALTRGWRPWAILAGLSLGLVLSSGEPVWAVVTLLAALALPGLRGAGSRRTIGAAAVAGATGLLIAAAQILPLAEIAGRSVRSEGLSAAAALKWSMPPAALLQSLLPGLWGDPSRAHPLAYWGAGLFDTSLPWLLSVHLGAPVLALAVFGATRRGAEWARPASILAVLGTMLALGRHMPLYGLVFSWLPGAASVRYPVKWFLLTTWCVAILAAAGVDAGGSESPRRGGRSLGRIVLLAAGGFALVAGIGAWVGGMPFLASTLRALLHVPSRIGDGILVSGAVPAVGRSLVLAGATILALALAASPRAERRDLRRLIAACACATALIFGAWGLTPSAPPELLAPSPLIASMPEVARGEVRLFGFPRPRGFAYRSPTLAEAESAGLPPDSLAWGMRWDVRTLRFATPYPVGVRGAFDQRGEALLDLRPGSAVAQRLREGPALEEILLFLRVASAGYLIAYGDLAHPWLREAASLPGESNIPTRLYALDAPLPRVYLADEARPASTPEEALQALRSGGVNLHSTVYVETPDGSLRREARGAPLAGPAGQAEILREGPSDVIVRVDAARPCWLVLTDTYDPSWRVTVDGERAPLFRANGMFRALPVPPGEHEVRFAYLPLAFVAGATLSGLALGASLLLCIVGCRRPARSAPAEVDRR
jgi:hypothetical protein